MYKVNWSARLTNSKWLLAFQIICVVNIIFALSLLRLRFSFSIPDVGFDEKLGSLIACLLFFVCIFVSRRKFLTFRTTKYFCFAVLISLYLLISNFEAMQMIGTDVLAISTFLFLGATVFLFSGKIRD